MKSILALVVLVYFFTVTSCTYQAYRLANKTSEKKLSHIPGTANEDAFRIVSDSTMIIIGNNVIIKDERIFCKVESIVSIKPKTSAQKLNRLVPSAIHKPDYVFVDRFKIENDTASVKVDDIYKISKFGMNGGFVFFLIMLAIVILLIIGLFILLIASIKS
jgi:hypothetical protein